MAETTHKYLDDEGEERECGGEDGYCPACFAKEAAYWGAYFGISKGMSREETRAQLERMDPRPVDAMTSYLGKYGPGGSHE